MRVMCAMSGGVDSSAAAALLLDAGHDVVGVTMKLWGGDSDTGCCSVSDVDDARRVADHLGIDHHVFNFSDDFDRHVVDPYVQAHADGRTPNPCIECNRHLKFDRLLERSEALGFDAVATGHHARIATRPDGTLRMARGADRQKDQSYVLYMLEQPQLAATLLPVGHMTKGQVRELAAERGLRTASKPDSQDVCFITKESGRARFLGDRMAMTPGVVVDEAGNQLGEVESIELVTIGQRKGLGVSGNTDPAYAVDVDVPAATVTVGPKRSLLAAGVRLGQVTWAHEPVEGPVGVQYSAHGAMHAGYVEGHDVRWDEPAKRVATGQAVVLYEGDEVVGGGLAVGTIKH